MKIPVTYRVQCENYEEGVFYIYSFIRDTCYILLFEGAMVVFDIDNYTHEKTEIINKRKISVGIQNGKYWRKDEVEGLRIYYENVSLKNKEMYDEILDSLEIKRFR